MKMNRRERLFVGVGAALLIVLAVYFMVVEPLAVRRDRLRDLTARMENDLAEMRLLAAEYRDAASRQSRLQEQVQARDSGFTPFSYLESLASQAGVADRIESMSPAASASDGDRAALNEFDVRLAGIRLIELVRYLYSIESSDKVFFVVNMSIRPRYLTPELLDVSLRLATPAVNG